jgi:hypothetical protein
VNLSHHTLAIRFLSARKCKRLLLELRRGALVNNIDSYTDNYIWLLFDSPEYRDAMLETIKSNAPNHSISIKNQKEVITIR